MVRKPFRTFHKLKNLIMRSSNCKGWEEVWGRGECVSQLARDGKSTYQAFVGKSLASHSLYLPTFLHISENSGIFITVPLFSSFIHWKMLSQSITKSKQKVLMQGKEKNKKICKEKKALTITECGLLSSFSASSVQESLEPCRNYTLHPCALTNRVTFFS